MQTYVQVEVGKGQKETVMQAYPQRLLNSIDDKLHCSS